MVVTVLAFVSKRCATCTRGEIRDYTCTVDENSVTFTGKDLDSDGMPSNGGFVEGVRGDFLLHSAVVDGKLTQPKRIQNAEDCAQKVMPKGTKVLSAERSGTSAWTRTGKITVLTPRGKEKRYFIKVSPSPGHPHVTKCCSASQAKAQEH